jgi:hypothetical protein
MKFVCIVAFLIILCRPFITPHLATDPSIEGVYEAVALFFVGFLLLVPIYDWKQVLGPSRWYGVIGLVILLWEGSLFYIDKFGLPH